MNIKIGDKYKIFFDENNVNNEIIHIVGIIDNDMIVYKHYGEHKKRWFYKIEHKAYFKLLNEFMSKLK